MARIFSYLSVKYGITYSGGTADYVDSAGTIIYDVSTHSAYTGDIAAIGRDDTQQLDQRQSMSTSTDALITIGNKNYTTGYNNAHVGEFAADRVFGFWANDGGDTSAWTGSNVLSGFVRLERQRKYTETAAL